MVVSSVALLSAAVTGFVLTGTALWLRSVWKRGRSCPQCACPTFLLAAPQPFRRVSRQLGERWCPACEWRGLAVRRRPSRDAAHRLGGRGRGPRWSSARPSPTRPPGWAVHRRRPAPTLPPPARGRVPGGALGRDPEPLPYPFRWGPPPRATTRQPLLSIPPHETPPSFPALYRSSGRREADPVGDASQPLRTRPLKRILFWGTDLSARLRGRLKRR